MIVHGHAVGGGELNGGGTGSSCPGLGGKLKLNEHHVVS